MTPVDLLIAAILLLGSGGLYRYWRRRSGHHPTSATTPGLGRAVIDAQPPPRPLPAAQHTPGGGARPAAPANDPSTALLDALPYAVFVHNGPVLYANPSAGVLRGARRDDLLTQPLTELLHPDDRQRVAGHFVARLRGEDAPPRYPVRLAARDGEVVHVELADALVEFRGAPAVLTCVFDLRAHDREVGSLRRAQEHYALALESLAEGVLTTDRDGAVQYANSAALSILGVDAGQALGSTLPALVSLVDEADRKPLADPVAACLHDERRVNLGRTALLLAADGEEHSIELGVAPMRREPDGLVGAVALLHDVSELRGLTRQMSYQASHDALTGLLNRREFERRLQ